MATVKRNNKAIREGRGRIDETGFAALTEADIARFAREDESDTSELGEPRYVPPKINLRALRKRLGLSQTEFARRYYLSLRSVQQWEQ
ncbi:MAG: helix-turn-helix domain-containing protein, partial [Vulcanimicrobiaceae bacterium]